VYKRLTRKLKDVGELVKASDIKSKLDLTNDFYQSLYDYPKDALDYFNKNGRIKGYKGEVSTSEIVFDIDSGDLEVSRKNTLILIDELKILGLFKEGCYKLSFSGSKGYHLFINTGYKFNPKELKAFCLHITKPIIFINEAGFKIDPTIYNASRIMRIVNTRNQKSGLFKVHMYENDLHEFTTDTISEFAEAPRTEVEYSSKIKAGVVTKLLETVEVKKAASKKEHKVFPKNPKKIVDIEKFPCYNQIQKGNIKEGDSNSALLRLAQFYRERGFTAEECRDYLVEAGINRMNLHPSTNPIDDEKVDYEILGSIYQGTGYTYTKYDDFLQNLCDGDCLLHTKIKSKKRSDRGTVTTKKGFGTSISTTPKPFFKPTTVGFSPRKEVVVTDMKERGFESFADTSKGFAEFAQNIDKSRILTGIKEFDDYIKIIPNGLTIINARPSVGKTSLVLNMMKECSKKNIHTLFYCADMEKDEFMSKMKSSILEVSPDDIYEIYSSNKFDDMVQMANDQINESFKTIHPCYQQRITVQKIEQDIRLFMEKGNKPGAIFIDYVQKMEGMSDYGKGYDTLIGLKEIVSKYKIPVILLSQIPRTGGDEETPVLTAAAAKGGSIYEETASVVINLWRPMRFAGQEMDNVIGYKIAKNRMGETGMDSVLHFEGKTSLIRSMNPEEFTTYEENMAVYQDMKKDRKKGIFR